MIVLDASVVVELLTNGDLADSIRDNLSAHDDALIAPHLLDVEVISAARGLMAGRRIGPDRGEQILTALANLPAERFSHMPLIIRIWLKKWMPCSTPAMRSCGKATGRES
jgi:predicted nucleic acid-binding protein